jgi:hypothetical protein
MLNEVLDEDVERKKTNSDSWNILLCESGSYASRASHASFASLSLFQLSRSFYSMLVYKWENEISLMHNPFILLFPYTVSGNLQWP